MNNEIELKYKVSNIPNVYDDKMEIIQIYFDGFKKLDILENLFTDLDFNKINTFRLRNINKDKYVITLKTKGSLSRLEYEKEISKDVFDSLCKDNILSMIIKNRYVLKHDKYCFEFDEYLSLKINLYTCEVELESLDDIDNDKLKIEKAFRDYFKIDYLDVSNDSRYKNSNLHLYF